MNGPRLWLVKIRKKCNLEKTHCFPHQTFVIAQFFHFFSSLLMYCRSESKHKCVRTLYSKRCLDHSILFTTKACEALLLQLQSLCGLQGSKHLLCTTTIVLYRAQQGGKESFSLRQFHVSWIGPQQRREQLETIITARITYIARTTHLEWVNPPIRGYLF